MNDGWERLLMGLLVDGCENVGLQCWTGGKEWNRVARFTFDGWMFYPPPLTPFPLPNYINKGSLRADWDQFQGLDVSGRQFPKSGTTEATLNQARSPIQVSSRSLVSWLEVCPTGPGAGRAADGPPGGRSYTLHSGQQVPSLVVNAWNFMVLQSSRLIWNYGC